MAMESKYAGKCDSCERTWNIGDKVYLSKTADGEKWIKCIDENCFKAQGGKVQDLSNKPRFTPTKFPIGDFPKLVALAEETLDSFLYRRYQQMHEIGEEVSNQVENLTTVANVKPHQLLTVNEQAIFIESMVRSMVTGCKP